MDTTKGPVVAEAFVPSAADTFDSAAQDTAAGLIRSALVIDGAQAKALTADPASVVVVEQWHHRFASGIALEGKLDGSLQAGFRLSLGSSGMSDVGGKDSRSSMTIDLVDCNAVLPSVLYGQDVNFFVLLVASGCSVRVNGAAPEDGFASASLGGDLDLVRVRSGGQPVHVAISGSRGEPLSSFDLTYTPGSD